jgi:uncharacterized protein
VAYLRGHGRRKVLFGTNYPMITAERALADLGPSAWTRRPPTCS